MLLLRLHFVGHLAARLIAPALISGVATYLLWLLHHAEVPPGDALRVVLYNVDYAVLAVLLMARFWSPSTAKTKRT